MAQQGSVVINITQSDVEVKIEAPYVTHTEMVYPMNITDIIKYIESTQNCAAIRGCEKKPADLFTNREFEDEKARKQGKDMNVTVQCTINEFAVSNTFDYNSWRLQVEHAINAVKIKKYKDVNGLLYYFVLMYVGNFF